MTRSTPRATRLRRLTVLAGGVTTAITLTACGAGSDTGTADTTGAGASPTPRGVVTQQAAEKVVDTYEKVNNQANRTRNAKLLATVEDGQVHEQSKADYELFETWPAKEQKDYGSPFTYTNRTYYLPAAGSATWFAVKARTSGSKSDTLMVFDKIGGTYKLVASVYTDGTPIPEIAVDGNGLATAVDPAERVGTLAPNQLATAYEDLFETGGTKEGKQLAPTAISKDALKTYEERDNGDEARWATKKFFAKDPAHPKVYALKGADGGVVTVFPIAHTQETMLKPAYMGSFQINPNEEEAVYNSTKRAIITDEFQGQAVAELPAKGKPKVTAAEYRMVDSR